MNTIKISRSLLALINGKEKEAKELKSQARLLKRYAEKMRIGK
jgi:hypothetical protein